MIPSLDIILVNRNSGGELFDCLSSVSRAEHSAFILRRVCVVDDASTDNSAAGLAEIPLPLEIIRNSQHTGYGSSCNRGAENSTADYILFLNTDSSLLHDSLDQPVRYMEQAEHSGVGIVGIQLLNDKRAVARMCTRFPTAGRMISNVLGLDRIFPSLFPSHQMSRWDHLDTREVDHVMGAFMLLRRIVFEQVGGYDEQFFVYMEDLDLSLRIRGLGYSAMYLSSAQAFHTGGGTGRRVWSESFFFDLRSRIQYAFKHFGVLRGGVVLATVMFLEPVVRMLFASSQRRGDKLKAIAAAYGRLWVEALSGRLIRRIRRGELTGLRNRKRPWDGRLTNVPAGVSVHSERGNG